MHMRPVQTRVHTKNRTRKVRVQRHVSSPPSSPSNQGSSPIIFEQNSAYSTNIPHNFNSIALSEASSDIPNRGTAVSSNDENQFISLMNSSAPSTITSFLDWLRVKKQDLKRAHCIITKNEYDTLLYCLKNYSTVINDRSYRWATKLIADNDLTIYQKHHENGDVIGLIVNSDFSRRRYVC